MLQIHVNVSAAYYTCYHPISMIDCLQALKEDLKVVSYASFSPYLRQFKSQPTGIRNRLNEDIGLQYRRLNQRLILFFIPIAIYM